MFNFLFEYRFIIVAFLGLVFFGLFEREQAKAVLYALMLDAKSLAKDMVLKSGREQEEWVINKAYIYLPKWMAIAIPRETMRSIVRHLYYLARDKLDDGKLNKSI